MAEATEKLKRSVTSKRKVAAGGVKVLQSQKLKLSLGSNDRGGEQREPMTQCDQCDKVLRQRYLQAHIDAEHSNKRFPCTECNLSFKYASMLTKHINRFHSLLAGDGMPKMATSSPNPYNPNGAFNCEMCRRSYKTRVSLKSHNDNAHSGKIFICPNCQEQFTQQHTLARHLRKEVCGPNMYASKFIPVATVGSFSEPQQQEQEQEQGSSDGLKLKTEGVAEEETPTVKTPKKDDSQYRPVNEESKCEFCEDHFLTYEDRMKHVNSVHKTADGERYQCPYCNKTVKTVGFLRAHVRSNLHTKEKKFHCDACEDQFATMKDLVKHRTMNHPELGAGVIQPVQEQQPSIQMGQAAGQVVQVGQVIHVQQQDLGTAETARAVAFIPVTF